MTDPAPEYVHDILDAYLGGELINFAGHEVPEDVQARLARAFDWDRRQEIALRERELPAKGWVQPGEVVYCDACGERCYVWSLHHILPISWGGSDSRLLADRQVVWVRVDSKCHDLIHMVLDHAQKAGTWPDPWMNQHGGMPHLAVEIARRGWMLWLRAQAAPDTT
jgi:hypothetical protein